MPWRMPLPRCGAGREAHPRISDFLGIAAMKRFSRLLTIEILEAKRLKAADLAQCELAHGPAFIEAADAAPTCDSAIEPLRVSHLEQPKSSLAVTASEETDDETDEQENETENETDDSDENDTEESDDNETDETDEGDTDDSDENDSDASDENDIEETDENESDDSEDEETEETEETDETDENDTDDSDENDTEETDENETEETDGTDETDDETDETDDSDETEDMDEEQSVVSAKLSAAATNDVGSASETSNESGEPAAATLSANSTASGAGSATHSALRSSASTAPTAGSNEGDSIDLNLIDAVYATAEDRHVTDEESALLQCESPADTNAAIDAVFEGVATNLLHWTA